MGIALRLYPDRDFWNFDCSSEFNDFDFFLTDIWILLFVFSCSPTMDSSDYISWNIDAASSNSFYPNLALVLIFILLKNTFFHLFFYAFIDLSLWSISIFRLLIIDLKRNELMDKYQSHVMDHCIHNICAQFLKI